MFIGGDFMVEVVKVKPMEDFILEIEFSNGEVKYKDMKPLFDKPIFSKIQDINIFNSVQVLYGAITWIVDDEEIDLCPDNTYKTSMESYICS